MLFHLISNINNKSLLLFFICLKYKKILITYVLFNKKFSKILFI